MKRVAVIGPVYPYRSAIAYCTGRLAAELEKAFPVDLISFSRQFPRRFYPGGTDVDESLRDRAPANARYALDILNPMSWLREGLRLRRQSPDAVVLVWWIWVWAIPYLCMLALLRRDTRVIVQCHNVEDKEPAFWKSVLANGVFRRADVLIVHSARSVEELKERFGDRISGRILRLFLPVISVGSTRPSREAARRRLGIPSGENVALFFGYVRPYKGLDIALRAWTRVENVLLVVAGEVWFGAEAEIRELTRDLGSKVRLDLRYIPDSEAADYFAAADVVVAPYRYENQSAVAMNAFEFGIPVIATAVGGLPDIVENGVNGLLVEPGSDEVFAAAVDRFFTEADRDRLSSGARDAAQKYSWARYGSVVSERMIAAVH
jgi:glycosyltransferase involved in cell wall biosynthesis